MPAISDSSVLILYARIGRLQLLQKIFSTIVIPPAVWDEVVENGADRPGTIEVTNASWIQIQSPSDVVATRDLKEILGDGEAEVIVLGLEYLEHIPLILDDYQARRVAMHHGRRVTGSAGVLLRAKQIGEIDQVQPLLEELLRAGLFLSSSAAEELLRLADEFH